MIRERLQKGHVCMLVYGFGLRKFLVLKFFFNNSNYKVEYEGINLICFQCGRFGHRMEA